MPKTNDTTLMFTGPGRVELVDAPRAPLAPDEVRIESRYSGISRGTEMTVYRGSSPFFAKAYDPTTRLFRAATEPAFTYPLAFGYENVGVVVERGRDVAGYAEGDVVFTPTPHATAFAISTTATGPFFGDRVPVLALPPGLAPELGVFTALAGVACGGVLDGGVRLGECVAVFGCGVIGLLTVQLCRRAGAEQVFAIDPVASRRALAARLGATRVFDPAGDDDVSAALRDLTDGRGADLAIETSGAYAGLHEAIRSVGYNGRVVVSSFLAGGGEGLRLGEEFHHNRVRLLSAQSFGVSPEISDRWSPARRTQTVLDLLPRLELAPMITHRVPFVEAARAFALVDAHPDDVLQVVLTY